MAIFSSPAPFSVYEQSSSVEFLMELYLPNLWVAIIFMAAYVLNFGFGHIDESRESFNRPQQAAIRCSRAVRTAFTWQNWLAVAMMAVIFFCAMIDRLLIAGLTHLLKRDVTVDGDEQDWTSNMCRGPINCAIVEGANEEALDRDEEENRAQQSAPQADVVGGHAAQQTATPQFSAPEADIDEETEEEAATQAENERRVASQPWVLRYGARVFTASLPEALGAIQPDRYLRGSRKLGKFLKLRYFGHREDAGVPEHTRGTLLPQDHIPAGKRFQYGDGIRRLFSNGEARLNKTWTSEASRLQHLLEYADRQIGDRVYWAGQDSSGKVVGELVDSVENCASASTGASYREADARFALLASALHGFVVASTWSKEDKQGLLRNLKTMSEYLDHRARNAPYGHKSLHDLIHGPARSTFYGEKPVNSIATIINAVMDGFIACWEEQKFPLMIPTLSGEYGVPDDDSSLQFHCVIGHHLWKLVDATKEPLRDLSRAAMVARAEQAVAEANAAAAANRPAGGLAAMGHAFGLPTRDRTEELLQAIRRENEEDRLWLAENRRLRIARRLAAREGAAPTAVMIPPTPPPPAPSPPPPPPPSPPPQAEAAKAKEPFKPAPTEESGDMVKRLLGGQGMDKW